MSEDNLVEYSDPQIYDLENSTFEPDGPFLLEIARKTGNPVLELGCGTGRLTIPMAQAGVDVPTVRTPGEALAAIGFTWVSK